MKLTTQLPLAVTSLRPEPYLKGSLTCFLFNDGTSKVVDTPELIRFPGVRVTQKDCPVAPGELIKGNFSITGRCSHLKPNYDWDLGDKRPAPKEIIDCDFSEIEKRVVAHHTGDINFEMTTGNVFDFLEAAMGPVYLGRCGPSDRIGFRCDPVDGLMYYRVSADLELPILSTDTGIEFNAEDYPESRCSSH